MTSFEFMYRTPSGVTFQEIFLGENALDAIERFLESEMGYCDVLNVLETPEQNGLTT